MEDLDGQGTTFDDLDPGIRKTVEWLLDLGYATCDSGDGHSKLSQGYSEDEILPIPHVMIQCRARSLIDLTKQLVKDLAGVGIEVGPIRPDGEGVHIQATYDPYDDSAVIGLFGVNDALLEKSRGNV